jgi:cysteine-rich repeat protein
MMTWQCQAPYYYFNLTSGLCQTLCGGYNIENVTEFICVPCQNTLCYQCDDPLTNHCTDCASYLHYELVDGQCVCMSGYLWAASICSLCWDANTGCYNCSYDDGSNGTLPYDSSKFVCLSCNETENYFMDGIRCTLCSLSHCLNCENLTACAICETGYDFSVIQTCIICHVTGCLHCSLTNPDVCVVCNQTLGYYENTTNQKCKTICGDGIFVGAEEGCDDGNLVNFDGCSASCSIESSFICVGSPSACTFSETVVLTVDSQKMEESVCDTITFGFRFSPASNTF